MSRFSRSAVFHVTFTIMTTVSVHGQSGGGRTPPSTGQAEIVARIRAAQEQSALNQRAANLQRSDYSWKWRKRLRQTNGAGRVEEKSELYEIYPPAKCKGKYCRGVRVLLEKDGAKVSPERMTRERLKAGKQLERAEYEAAGTVAEEEQDQPNWMNFYFRYQRPFGDDIHLRLDGHELVGQCEFFSPQRETVGGREMIALSFRPRPQAVFSKETSYLHKMQGKVWLDVADRVFARFAAWPGDAMPDGTGADSLLEGAAAAYDLVRVREGLWLFRFGRINGDRYPGLFGRMRTDFTVEASDYIRFRVEAEERQLLVPEKQS